MSDVAVAEQAPAPKIEAPQRPPEVVRPDVITVGTAAIRQRTARMTEQQRTKDPIAQISAIPQAEAFKSKGLQNEDVEGIALGGAELKIRGSFADSAGQESVIDGAVSKIMARRGDTLTIALVDGSQHDVPMSLVEVAQLASEMVAAADKGQALLESFPEGQRLAVEAMVKDFNGDPGAFAADGLDAQIQSAGQALGLLSAEKFLGELAVMKTQAEKGTEGDYDAAIQEFQGRLVVSPEDRQALISSLRDREVSERSQNGKLSVEDMRSFVRNLKPSDIPPGTNVDDARTRALADIATDFTPESVMKAFADLGMSKEGMQQMGAGLDGAIKTAKAKLLEMNGALKAFKQVDSSNSEQYQAIRTQFNDTASNLNSLVREQATYKAAATLFENGGQSMQQAVQGLIEGTLPGDKAPQIIEAFRAGDMNPFVLQLTNDALAKSDIDPVAKTLEQQAIIDAWKKRGKEGGLLALAALLATLTSLMEGAVGGGR